MILVDRKRSEDFGHTIMNIQMVTIIKNTKTKLGELLFLFRLLLLLLSLLSLFFLLLLIFIYLFLSVTHDVFHSGSQKLLVQLSWGLLICI
jgi:hypothetical protein